MTERFAAYQRGHSRATSAAAPGEPPVAPAEPSASWHHVRVRVYLPATLPGLSALEAGDDVAVPGAVAYAVTPGLREWYREADLEELEYVALTHAAHASLYLLVSLEPSRSAGAGSEIADSGGRGRRVVLAADVPDAAAPPDPDADIAAVRLGVGVSLTAVVSAHVDSLEAVPHVRAAIDRLEAGDADADDAQFAVEGLDDHELQWYAAQELPDLLG
jgi:hypothetical protein